MSIIKDSRLATGLTQAELADMANVTRRYIISLERHVPENVPEGVLLVLSDLLGVTPDSLSNAYALEYQAKSNEILELIHDLEIDFSFTSSLNFEDFRGFLGNQLNLPMSQIKFSEYFRVNPAEISAYERRRCRTMPTSIAEALAKIGLTPLQIASIHVNSI